MENSEWRRLCIVFLSFQHIFPLCAWSRAKSAHNNKSHFGFFFSPRKEEHKIFDYSQTMRRQLYKQKQPSRQLVMKMPQCHTAILETYLFYHSRPSNVNKYCRFACSYHLFFCPGLAFSFSVSQKFSIILDVILRTNIIDVWIKHGIYVAAPYIIRTSFKCVMKIR